MPSPDTASELAGLTSEEHRRAGALFGELFGGLQRIGLAQDGSSTRLAWTPEIAQAEAWFDETARGLGLTVTSDGNGNRWAWSAPGASGAVVTGSHLDTVPRGGRFDGALGVVSGLIAARIVLDRGGAGRPLAVVAFADEEGGRFNTPTFGSRLLVGALDPQTVLERTDRAGVRLDEALEQAGLDPAGLGPDEALLSRLNSFVELHIEQGTLLGELGQPLGVATSIMPHGRWRVELAGQSNHGGTTAMTARRDPMLALAELLQTGRRVAEQTESLVTVGRLQVWPNAPTSIAQRVTAWLDVRCPAVSDLDRVLAEITAAVLKAASDHGLEVAVQRESRTPGVTFSPALAERIRGTLARAGTAPVSLSTGAGHDAGVLAVKIPTAMLFVRNRTGISHAPQEGGRTEDCLTGIGALVAVLEDLRSAEAEGRGA